MFVSSHTTYLYQLLLKKNILIELFAKSRPLLSINSLNLLFYQLKKTIISDQNSSFIVPKIINNKNFCRQITSYIIGNNNFHKAGNSLVDGYVTIYSYYFFNEKSHNVYKFGFMTNLFKFKNKNFFVYHQSIIKKNIKNIFLLFLNLGYGGKSFHWASCRELEAEVNIFNKYSLKKISKQKIRKNKPLEGSADLVVILDLQENFNKISFYKSLGAPIVGVTSHYTNPEVVDYPILVDTLDYATKYFIFCCLSNIFLTGKTLKNKYYRRAYVRMRNLSFLCRASVSGLLNVSIYSWVNSFFLMKPNLSQKYILWLIDRNNLDKTTKKYKKPVKKINPLMPKLSFILYTLVIQSKPSQYLTDLFIRFSPYSMKLVRRKVSGKRWLSLPCFANIAAVPRFQTYRGGVLTVGDKNYLPMNVTYSGIALPFLIRFNKTPLWLPHWYSFSLSNYPFKKLTIKDHVKPLKASNLLINNLPSIGQLAVYRSRPKRAGGAKLLHRTGHLGKLYSINKGAPNFLSPRTGAIINSFAAFLRAKNARKARGFRYRQGHPRPRSINIKVRQSLYLRWYRLNYNLLFCKRFRNKKLNKIFDRSYGGSLLKQKILTELNIVNVLLRSHFIYLYTDAVRCVQLRLVTVNGYIVSDINYSCKQFDRISFILSKSYFSYFRSVFSSSISKEYRSTYYYYTTSRLRAKKFKTPKMKNPKWPRKIIWERSDIPKYLEVDFLTMTSVVVYEPHRRSDFFVYFNKYHNLPTRRMFNWKYLY